METYTTSSLQLRVLSAKLSTGSSADPLKSISGRRRNGNPSQLIFSCSPSEWVSSSKWQNLTGFYPNCPQRSGWIQYHWRGGWREGRGPLYLQYIFIVCVILNVNIPRNRVLPSCQLSELPTGSTAGPLKSIPGRMLKAREGECWPEMVRWWRIWSWEEEQLMIIVCRIFVFTFLYFDDWSSEGCFGSIRRIC